MNIVRELISYGVLPFPPQWYRRDSDFNKLEFDNVGRYECSIELDLRKGMDIEILPAVGRWPWVNKPKRPRDAQGYLIDEKDAKVMSDWIARHHGEKPMDDKTTASIKEPLTVDHFSVDPKLNPELKLDRELLDFNAPLTLPPGVVGQRVTESYNPLDVYVCPNGHLAYNLTPDALADCRSRNVVPPPIVYEGGRCWQCSEPYNRLEHDAKELQFRVANFMRMAARLKAQEEGLLKVNSDYNAITLFMRYAYGWEIEQGEPQHSGELSKAVTYYLRKERRRFSVVAGKVWRAVKRMMGAQ